MEFDRRKPSWWRRRSRLEQILLCTSSSLFILLLIIPAISRKANKDTLCKRENSSGSIENGQEVCLTKGCAKSAAQVIKQMDLEVDPCEDFFAFACGTYVKNAKIPNDKTNVNAFTIINDQLQEQLKSLLEEPVLEKESEVFRLAKKYYESCVRTDVIEKKGLTVAKKLLESLGGWPVLHGRHWKDSKFDWKETIHALRSLGLETNTIIELAVGFDLRNTSRRIIQLDQPTLGLDREFFLKDEEDKILQAYYDYMVDVAVMFGADRTNAERDLQESLIFEMRLAKHSLSQEERRNITNLYNKMSVKQLQNIIPSIPWLQYLNGLLPQEVAIGSNEEVLVGVPDFLKKLEILMHGSPKRTQANYLMWRAVHEMIPYLNQELRERELQYRHVVDGIVDTPPRWKQCVDLTTENTPLIIGSLYVRRYFNEDAKRKAAEMVKYIKDAFKIILTDLDWMDNETKSNALKKADNIVDHVAYPSEMLDDKKIVNLYKYLHVRDDEFLRSTLNITKYWTDFSYGRLRKLVNKTDWIDHGNPAQVNAFYQSSENSIILPAGILQGNLFNKDRPRYMNFGAIGSVIGHEITHGFDDTGRQFDQHGNLIDWWEKHTQDAFLDKAKCIVHQYGNYTVAEVNMKLNGVKTLGENIADNGGVKEAYLAYLKWTMKNPPEPKLPGLPFDPFQMFWISAAQNWCSRHRPESLKLQIETDVHVPEKYRVLGPFSNLEYFARDFKCPKGSKMNPAKKCSVW